MGGCCATETEVQNERLENIGGIARAEKNASAMGINKASTAVEDPTAGRKKKYAKNKPIVLGYWKIRGLAQPIRYLLEYIEHPYQDCLYEQGDAPNFSIECWTSVKNTLGLDFPNIPYIIDDDTKLTDCYAIMIYLSTKYAPELLGQTPEQKGEIDMIYSQLKDIKSAITGPCYVGVDRKILMATAKNKLAPIVKYLGKKDFLTGDTLTFIDFYMLEMCDFVQFLTENEFFNENKAVQRYVKRMKNLKQIKRYIKSERYIEKPFNNKVAKINNM